MRRRFCDDCVILLSGAILGLIVFMLLTGIYGSGVGR